ncbi:MAG: capsule assembly Wzi family protein [Tolumonas sp.]|nr:capsule assembly Wzi family protein [Tolumonas sp.]
MKKNHIPVFVCALLTSHQAFTSPWVEADDPFLRSDLQFMTDSGLLLMPVNTYPVRWSLFSDQFSQIDIQHLSEAEELAYRNVQYRLDSERLGRGRSHLTITGATDSQAGNNGFGGYLRTKAGISASHEIIADQFAFRVASGYRQAEVSNDRWNFDNSYFAVASHDISLSVGWLERWWGPGWQHSSGIAQQSYPLPAFSFSYQQPQVPLLGALWFETLIAKQDNNIADDYLSASRLALRPTSYLQMGATYKSWFGNDGAVNKAGEWLNAVTPDNNNGLYSIDARISSRLPWQGAGGIYGEQGRARNDSLKYQMTGADAQWLLGKQSMRAVVEYAVQQETASNFYQQTLRHKRTAIISIPADKELSIGSYWQFSTEQQLALFWHLTSLNDDQIQRITSQFKQPALAGLVTLNISVMDQKVSGQDRNNFGINYEYRFK